MSASALTSGPNCTLCPATGYREQTVDDKKKPEMLERIVAGKVSKRMAELCLVSQVSALYVWCAACCSVR
jgi:translation elongation factor EF-Ts